MTHPTIWSLTTRPRLRHQIPGHVVLIVGLFALVALLNGVATKLVLSAVASGAVPSVREAL